MVADATLVFVSRPGQDRCQKRPDKNQKEGDPQTYFDRRLDPLPEWTLHCQHPENVHGGDGAGVITAGITGATGTIGSNFLSAGKSFNFASRVAMRSFVSGCVLM